jgi:dihydroorotate dehydrogenase
LLFVVQGAALLTAGVVISCVGMTSVFVVEDLEFMQTTVEELVGAHPRLVPLVAHDRATFGGMLIACGLATLLPALWGFARGERWLWWSLMLAGTFAYSATMQVHWAVGYHDPKHLLPAIAGLALLWAGGAASYAYVAGPDLELAAEWRRRLAARIDSTGRS